MNEETVCRLLDVLAACQAIEQFVVDMDYDSYIESLVTRSAVERQLEIIGEALKRAAMSDNNLETRLPELRRVVGLRNRLIHGYDSVDDEIVWDATQIRVPASQTRLTALLVQSGNPPANGESPYLESIGESENGSQDASSARINLNSSAPASAARN